MPPYVLESQSAVAGVIRQVLCLSQQCLPFLPRQAAIVEIGACPFAAMVEEADIVVGLFQRLDLARDEAVEFIEIGDEIGRQVEIQGGFSRYFWLLSLAFRRYAAPRLGSI